MERVIASCFDDPLGRAQAKLLRKIQGKVYKKRWGSIAFHVQQVRAVSFLRRRWSLEMYSACGARPLQRMELKYGNRTAQQGVITSSVAGGKLREAHTLAGHTIPDAL